MPVKKEEAPMSAFERRRLENMAANTAILKDISITAKKVAPSPKPKAKSRPKPVATTSCRKRTRTETTQREAPRPTRQSSRLAGIAADNNEVKSDLDTCTISTAAKVEGAKRQRVTGNVKLEELAVDGKKWTGSSAGLTELMHGAQAGVCTFTENDISETTDEGLKKLRQNLGKLRLYGKWAPNDIKITPLRVYALGFHPTQDKPLIFAGDKEGALGVFDASQEPVKAEADDDDDGEEYVEDPKILAFKTHARTISSFAFSPIDVNSVYSSSYDSSIRKLDLAKGVSVDVWSPEDADTDVPISTMEIVPSDPNTIMFSTLSGTVCKVDMRTPGTVEEWRLSDQKIGGFSIHPLQPHLVVTASLDRTMKVWDLRKMTGKGGGGDERSPFLIGTHASRLSVSHAAWSPGGHVATSSYDDTIKIYDFSSSSSWKAGQELPQEDVEPAHIVRHNNQTGRWVTILKPQWQRRPLDGIQKFTIGNMNRFVDVYAADGSQLAQLDGDGISAVPAVCHFHPTLNWVAGGTASGKLCLWM